MSFVMSSMVSASEWEHLFRCCYNTAARSMWEAKIDESLAIEGTHLHPFIPDSLAGPRKILTSYENSRPEWIAELKKRGHDHVDLEQLIAFRIHGVSPEFIDKLQGLGYKHPDPDELIAMRIHQVTPEYISDLRSRGMHDLSIDQLVSMRIHGID